MKIKVREAVYGCMPVITKKGDWIDLVLAEEVTLTKKGEFHLASLGVAMKLPDGMEAVVVPRSSTFMKHHISLANSLGVIDRPYNGDDDIWRFPMVAERKTIIPKGTRIAQFRIQPSQFATPWQKIKYLFSRDLCLVKVDSLNGVNRGGFGTTGK